MYAVPVSATFTNRAAADAGLDEVVAQISSLPGFVTGYWVALSPTAGTALIVFDSGETAQGFVDLLMTAPDMPGVMLDRDSLAVGEVVAHA
jgi:hypothetical protein